MGAPVEEIVEKIALRRYRTVRRVQKSMKMYYGGSKNLIRIKIEE